MRSYLDDGLVLLGRLAGDDALVVHVAEVRLGLPDPLEERLGLLVAHHLADRVENDEIRLGLKMRGNCGGFRWNNSMNCHFSLQKLENMIEGYVSHPDRNLPFSPFCIAA